MVRTSLRLIAPLVLCLSVAACGGAGEAAPDPAPAAAAPAPAADPAPAAAEPAAERSVAYGICVELLTRQADCTDAFIPALVAARVSADVPEGIAALDAEKGREALIAMALEEWKVDRQPANIEASCEKVDTATTAEERERMIPVVRDCLASETCESFTACAIPIVSARW